jgi:hypothetical protein
MPEQVNPKVVARTKDLLLECYRSTQKFTGINPAKPGLIKQICLNDKHFDFYVKSLSEGLSDTDKAGFRILAENTRKVLLENSLYQLNPYETLALPLLRVFYPKTVAKELVTVIPMDKPEIIRGFVRVTFNRFNDANTYRAPSSTDISAGPGIGFPVAATAAVPGQTDILAVVGLSPDVAHIEKSFTITKVIDGAANELVTSITPTVDGEFSAAVTVNGVDDVLCGRIDYLTGILDISSVNSVVATVEYTATVSLEENTINPRASFNIEKLRLFAKDRQISTEWTVQFEQDIKALFNVNTQAELVSVIGQQIVLDIDREIVNSLIFTAERLAGTGHVATFSKTPPPNFTWGPKMWLENVTPVMNNLSAQVYNDTNIAAANVVACNPLDAAIFESLQDYRYTGSSSADGDLGYESATVAAGKWKILVSNVVPQGKAVMLYKPTEELRAVYIFAPYVPAVLTPYPLGNIPSLTVLSRYGTQLIRPEGVAELRILP